MFDDFLTRALLAGLATAALTGPIGCFIIWRRMSFFGDTLSHSALLGVAIGLLLSINQTISVFMIALGISACLQWLGRRATLSADATLGILSHGTLALGLLLISFLPPYQIDITSVFFGDILASSVTDVIVMISGMIAGLIVVKYIWHPLLVTTINTDIATAEGIRSKSAEFIFMILLTMVISFSFKIVGVLLISALLVIPAAAARQLAKSPEVTALFASVIGCVSVTTGLGASLYGDLPSGPAIVCAALALFVISFIIRQIKS
ncbi:MAG: metal ABC transporter permease [Candidatus Puniceispirillaceae bacterium]